MRRLLELLLVAVLISAAAVAVVAIAGGSGGCDEGFDRAAWAEGGESRVAAAERAVECGSLDGLSRREVRALLGAPDERSTRRLERWSWEAGPGAGGYALDSRFLTVDFGRDGRVARARVYTG